MFFCHYQQQNNSYFDITMNILNQKIYIQNISYYHKYSGSENVIKQNDFCSACAWLQTAHPTLHQSWGGAGQAELHSLVLDTDSPPCPAPGPGEQYTPTCACTAPACRQPILPYTSPGGQDRLNCTPWVLNTHSPPCPAPILGGMILPCACTSPGCRQPTLLCTSPGEQD